MEGSLSEIDICSILQLIELGQRTGLLLIETDEGGKEGKYQSWFVFFVNGEIIYASNGDNRLSRLSDGFPRLRHRLRHYQVQTLPRLDEVQLACLARYCTPEYGYIWMLLDQNLIKPKIACSIIYSLLCETLFDLLSLHQGRFIFQSNFPLAPQLTSLQITPLLNRTRSMVRQWKELYPYVESKEQVPILIDIAKLNSELPLVTVKKLQQWADGKTSLHQLACYLNRDILTVAKAMYPYIQQGWIKLVYLSSSGGDTKLQDKDGGEKNQKQRIVCIDEALSICQAVELILQLQGYETQTSTNSLEALNLVFQTKPDLILCDIAMPELDGYDFCAMLRRCKAFRHVPIIMLTYADAFIDRLQAKMVGATDYLTKPFGNNELVILVKKYLHPDTTLVDRSKME